MLNNEILLVFGEDYGRHPHCLEHIINELLPNNTVLWIETIGMRSPRFSLYDMQRSLQILAKWIFGRKKTSAKDLDKNLKIIAPVMLPFTSLRAIRKINQVFTARKIKQEIKKRGLARPIFITSIPGVCDFAKKFQEKLTVYYCVDEFSLWPGIPHARVKMMEEELMSKSDIIFATSSALADSKKASGKETYLLTHGVDVKHFELNETFYTANIWKKRICYFGLIDERCDQKLIAFLAHSLPDCLFTIIGEVTVADTFFLKKHSNVCFERRVSYEALPAKIKDQDYFILPYHINELTNNINPLKIKEYLATGRPVISTPLPEVVKLAKFLYVAGNQNDFVKIIKGLMSGEFIYSSSPTLQYLEDHETWKAKAAYFCQKMNKAILTKELSMQ